MNGFLGNLFLCRLNGEFIEGRFIKKSPSDEYGLIYANIKDSHNEYHQVKLPGATQLMDGGFYFNLEELQYSNSFNVAIHSISKKASLYGEYEGNIFYDYKNDLRACGGGKTQMKALPEAYTQKESAIIVGVGVIILLIFYIVFRKYFFKRSKHKN